MTRSVHDIAAYILRQAGPMSTWKFQKLVYYAQAWHLAWEEEPLFTARIEAWANGPVVPELYREHRGRFHVKKPWAQGNPEALDQKERETIDAVLETYGKLDGRALSHLTHSEAPWRDARGDLPPTALSSNEITPEAMQVFYAALDADEGAARVADLNW